MNLKNIYVVIVTLSLSMGFGGYYGTGDALAKDIIIPPYLQTGNGSAEQPVAPEKNPTGDIPDSQVFVNYTSNQGGYDIETPEGWARTTKGGDVIFTYKLDGLSVTVTNAARAPNAGSVRKIQAELLKMTGRAVRIKGIQDIKLSYIPAVLMMYESNSDLDLVVNKQVRLENSSYFYYRNGRLAELRLWAPLGADNIDQWKLISNSFRWR